MLAPVIATLLLSSHMALSAPPISLAAGHVTPWDITTYCNAPHVTASHYKEPEKGAELVHVSVLMRHHKRAPAVLVPNEREININQGWDCSGVKQFAYNGGGAHLYHTVTTPPGHPFARKIWAGTCDVGQLTPGGFHDSITHGKDLWGLYHTRLGFLSSVEPSEISVRTTYVDRTKQVASGVLAGMAASTTKREWAVHAQPELIDSLVPSYGCPRADALLAEAHAAPFWQDVWQKNSALRDRLDTVLGTENSTSPYWRLSFSAYQDVITARTCNDHPLPCNAAGDCVSEADATEIFALGNFEADYLWHVAESASEYTQLTFGVLFSELADALESPKHRLALYVAHDISIVRLAAGLKIFPLRWPRLGSEIVIEIWKAKNNKRFVRVLYDGELIDSLKWIPLGHFIHLLRHQVPENIFGECMSASGEEQGSIHPSVLFAVQ